MTLTFQIVVELAELMQMEKKAVSESVKENRADELSSMFNMLIDEKKRQKGCLLWSSLRFCFVHRNL